MGSAQMHFLCQTCGQTPFLLPQTWNESTEESIPSQSMLETLASYVKNLKMELQAANKAFKTAQARVSPIFRLPDDILIQIFDDIFLDFTGAYLMPSQINRYTLVCHRWRDIIISIPKFWTTIIPAPCSTPEEVASFNRLLEMQVDRAKAVPMLLDCSDEFPETLRGIPSYALERIGSFRVDAGPDIVDEVIEFCHLLPNLCRLEVTFWESSTGGFLLPLGLNLSSSFVPRLTHIELNLEHPFDELSLPWAQLISLKMHWAYRGNVHPHDIITHLERIQDLELDFGTDIVYPAMSISSQLCLPYLRTIALSGYEEDDFPFELLKMTKFSSLKELKFTLESGREKNMGQALVSSLNNPTLSTMRRFHLDFLSLPSCCHTPEIIEQFFSSLGQFRHLDGLEEFSCNVGMQPGCADRVLEALGRRSDRSLNEYLFPQLCSLKITQVKFVPTTFQALENLLQHRVSCIELPVAERKTLKRIQLFGEVTVIPNHVVVNGRIKMKTAPMRTFSAQIYKPVRYNDRTTCVLVRAGGYVPDGYLERLAKTAEMENIVEGP